MYDDLDLGGPLDYDDFELPPPMGEEDEDVSESPTEIAGTEELLAAVTARVEANASIGEVELELEPTLAHQAPPVVPSPIPAPQAAAPPAAAQPAQAAATASPSTGGNTMAVLAVAGIFFLILAGATAALLLGAG